MDTPVYIYTCFSTSLDISFAPKKSFRLHELFIFSSMRWQFLQQNHQAFLATKTGYCWGSHSRFGRSVYPLIPLGFETASCIFCCWWIFLVSELWFRTCRLWVLWNKNGFLKTNDSTEVRGGCCDAVCIIYFGCLSSCFLDFLSRILPCKEQAHTTTPQPLPSRNQGITKPNSSYWGLFNRSLEVLNLIGCFKG